MGYRGFVQRIKAMLPFTGLPKLKNQYTKEVHSYVPKSSFAITGV